MKNLRFWAYTSAFLSIVISLAMIGFWISGVWELKVVNLNTFVGVTVSLLAIIVTLAIAWQIYNAVDMKNKVEELKQLEGQLEEQKKSFDQFKLETTRDLYGVVWAIIPNDQNDPFAFLCFLLDLEVELKLLDANQHDDI